MHRVSLTSRLGVLAVAFALVGWLSPAAAQITFDNGCVSNSAWDCADNWDTDTVPANGDNVVIGSFTVTGTFTAAALTSLTLNGTTLNTDGTMSVGQLDWSGGSINAGATLTVIGTGSDWSGSSRSFSNVTFRIAAGAEVVQTAGTLFLQSGTRFENAGLYDLQNNADIDYSVGAAPEFVNESTGTLHKSSGTGSSVIDVALTNEDGLIDVDAGSLLFTRSGALDNGTYDVAAGATLRFDAGTFTATGTLTGTVDGFIGHDVTLTVTDSSTVTLAFPGSGAGYQWPTGTISAPGAGQFTNTGLLTLTTGSGKTLSGLGVSGNVVLRNEGTIRHEAGTLFIQTGGVLENAGLYDLASDADIDYTSGAAPEFVNESTGTLHKSSGTASSVIDVALTNEDGLIDVDAGSLLFTRSGALDNGTYDVAAGATLRFDAGTFTATGTLTGTVDGFIGHDVTLTVADGTTVTLAFPGSGAGYQWPAGTISAPGAGQFINTGLLTLAGSGGKTLSGAAAGDVVLRNEGTIRHEAGTLFIQSGGVLENASLYDLQSNVDIDYTSGALTEFVNESTGTLHKSSGTGSSVIDVALTNEDGLIDVDAGSLLFTRDTELNDGTYDVALDATLRVDAGAFTATGTLTGTVDGFIGHDVTLTVADGTAPTLAFPGSGAGYQWLASSISAPGTGVLINTGLLTLAGTGGKTLSGTGVSGDVVLRNEGTIRHEAGTLFIQTGGVLENAGLYDLASDADLDYTSGAAPEFVNEGGGTFRKSAGAATSTIDVPTTNESGATILANTGILNFTRTFLDNQAGATLGGSATINPIPTSPYVNDGIIAPGTSPGILTWQGALTMSASSRFVAEIGGTTPGDDYDQLAVTGDATLGGTLEIAIAVGDAPGIGDIYTVLTAGGELTGTFGTVVGPFGYTFDIDIDEANDEVTVEVLTVPNFDLAAVNTDPTGSPIVVAKPGAIDFSYVVTNNTTAPITGDVFFTASLGSNVLAQGVILSGTLPANTSSPVLSFTQGVPGIAPVGTYTYSIKIGQFPSTVVDQVDFTVIVTPAAREADEVAAAWLVEDATPWIGADGSVLMIAPEPTSKSTMTPETGDAAEVASAAVPDVFGLAAAYPNPFRASATFALDVPEAGRVTVAVYDALGRRVAVLLDGEVEAGTHRLDWNAASLPSGVYIVRATGAGATAVQRVTLVR